MTDINLTGKISAASMSGRLSNLYIPKDVTEYDGPTSITPSTVQQQFDTARKLVNENLVVEGAKLDGLVATENGTYRPAGDAVGFGKVDVYVQPDLRPLEVDSLTQSNATFLPDDFDGYDSVTVEEKWDGSLVPDESGSGFFHCKHVDLLSTDILMIEGYGGGYRWASVKSNYPAFVQFNRDYGVGSAETPPVHVRVFLVPTDDTSVVIGGPAWGADGSVTTTNYSFKGDYLRWKVIHAT